MNANIIQTYNNDTNGNQPNFIHLELSNGAIYNSIAEFNASEAIGYDAIEVVEVSTENDEHFFGGHIKEAIKLIKNTFKINNGR